jgi:hypothetical protein
MSEVAYGEYRYCSPCSTLGTGENSGSHAYLRQVGNAHLLYESLYERQSALTKLLLSY